MPANGSGAATLTTKAVEQAVSRGRPAERPVPKEPPPPTPFRGKGRINSLQSLTAGPAQAFQRLQCVGETSTLK